MRVVNLLQTSRCFQLGEGWVLFQPNNARLMALNNTGKLVLDLFSAGYGQDEIASFFVLQFDLSAKQAESDVQNVLADLIEVKNIEIHLDTQISDPKRPSLAQETLDSLSLPNCFTPMGTFCFGSHCVQIHLQTTLVEHIAMYFSRFYHRLIPPTEDATLLEIFRTPEGFQLRFQGEVIATKESSTELHEKISELLLAWEHPHIDFLAYFHAAAISKGPRSVLLPGVSGSGKTTLTAFLVGHGFDYHGDDVIAMAINDGSLRPLPTQLSIKTGSWLLLESLYPTLPNLPTINCYGREVRYVQPRQTKASGHAPSVILFPTYKKERATQLSPLTPFQTMIRLLETSMNLDQPATEEKLAELIRFVETTPAYILTYNDLSNAKAVIEELLDDAN